MTIETLMIQPLFIGTTELLLIGGVALLLFGGKKLPEMMRGLGQGVKEFKKGMNDAKAVAEEREDEENLERKKTEAGEGRQPGTDKTEDGKQQER